MGHAKELLADQERNTSHLECCLICDGVLHTWQEREDAFHQECFEWKLEQLD